MGHGPAGRTSGLSRANLVSQVADECVPRPEPCGGPEPERCAACDGRRDGYEYEDRHPEGDQDGGLPQHYPTDDLDVPHR